MENQELRVKILLPSKVFWEKSQVVSLKAETTRGAMGIRPHRLDCVAALVAGILSCELKNGETIRLAVDEGILVKNGFEVLISVRHAMEEKMPGRLREALEHELANVQEREKELRRVLATLETSLVRRLSGFASHG